MKSAVAFSAIVLAFGIAVEVRAQSSTDHAAALPAPDTNATTGIGTTSKNASGTPQSDDTKSDAEGDDTYRMKTQESLASGAMSRDEGQLTRKSRRSEKILEVESTKQLPTSGIDPKFQGSLLHSSVTSIDYVGEKANEEAGTVKEEAVPSFKKRHRVFTPEKSEESTKKETPRTEADSSPSPTPSPTVSPSAPNR